MKKLTFLFLLTLLPLMASAQNNSSKSTTPQKTTMTAEEMYKLGLDYYKGSNGKAQNYTEAVKWFRNAAEQGNVKAQTFMGGCCYNGSGVTQDYTEAVDWYRKAAEQGYDKAQFNLGNCYHEGKGVTKDYIKAVKWYRKAAKQGHTSAQFNLGNCYKNGEGVTKDYTEAVSWYRKAAEKGHAKAQYSLGYYYRYGKGVTKDYTEAAKWTRKAAEQGHAQAQYTLGYYYKNGEGVTKNATEAVKWYRKAAEQGYDQAQYNLANCYKNGEGVTKDLTEAIKWYRKAAEQGHANAKRDLTEAMKWYQLIAGQGQADKKLAEERIKNTDNNIAKQPTQPQTITTEIDTDIPNVGISNDKTFVVIFANEKYQEVAPVEYALNDGETFKKYCKSVLGIPDNNIHMRKNATKNNMIAEMSWMKKVANIYNGEAKFIVYYAGHGVPDEKSNTAYLLPVDGLATDTETAYSMTTFYQKLGSLNATNVIVFMDACFSGAQRGEGMLASARGVVITPRAEAPSGKMVVFSAAQGDETAYPYKEKGHGLFTYFLLKKLHDTKGNCTLQELGDYIRTNVKRQSIVVNNKSQTPTVSVSHTLSKNWKTMILR